MIGFAKAHLPFLDRKTVVSYDLRQSLDAIERALPGIQSIKRANIGDGPFQSKDAIIEMRNLRITALSHSPLSLVRDDEIGFCFWLPIEGGASVQIEGKNIEFAPGEHGFITLPERRTLDSTASTSVSVDFNKDVLENTFIAMSGHASKRKLNIGANRKPALRHDWLDFTLIFKSLFEQIDHLDGQAAKLQALGLDISIYRAIATILDPSLFFEEARPVLKKEIVRLCDFIKANLQEQISLTKMEEISGLSARSLQLAFQKHFGMRPKQWVQHERLHEAYRIIKIGHEEMSMTELSYSLGFASPSLFAQAYRKKFGELPSMTKKNRE